MTDANLPVSNQNPQNSYIDAYSPPTGALNPADEGTSATPPAATPAAPQAAQAPQTPQPSQTPESTETEKIEDQNIFSLLGATDGTEEEKEAFLDELQQVIWEDFLENDVDLLLTQDEKAQLDELKAKTDTDPEQAQEEMVVFLEKLIPDLEEIMLEKALELKEDLVKERIAGLKEYFAGKQAQLDQLAEAENFVSEDKWRSAAEKLNSISE